MKRLVSALAIVLGWASAAWAAPPAPLTTLRAIHLLTNDQARQALPVAFEATVTYYRGYENTLFVQDGDAAIYVSAARESKLVPGDRVLVKGTTQGSFRPTVAGTEILLLRHGAVPQPIPASFEELIRSQHDCMLVTVHGVVRAADLEQRSNLRDGELAFVTSTRMQMLTEGGNVEAYIDSDDASAPAKLLDAEVEITGVAGGAFDGKMQQTGVLLHVSTLTNVKVLKRAAVSARSLPLTPMDQIITSYRVHDLTQRVRVQGTITYYEHGSAVVLQSGSKSLWVSTRTESNDLRVGDEADAAGFPDAHTGFLTLANGEIWDRNVPAYVTPQPATWKQLASSSKLFDLVSIEGQVVTEVREAFQDEYVLSSDGQLFTAILGHRDRIVPPMRQIAPGSRVRVTGICILEDSNPFSVQVPFNILMRSADDIVVVVHPSLLNVRNLILVVGLLLAVVFAVGARGWFIERRVRRQTSTLAALERSRRRILEDINGSRPLAEIVEGVAELVSFKLNGAPCWCQITGGARLGNCPPEPTALRIVQGEIPSRSGPALGTIFAGLDPQSKPSHNEQEALSMGAGLATLAIETRRLYTDLLHRSEFDLLTDIHNRFSLDRQLDALIEGARQSAGIFGLIYIDLDWFKQINDFYGHQIGDMYLHEVALRMKRQLRSHDMLARLGGDEFAALVSVVRSRADVEEIALRLERCFDDPLAMGGYVLHGSASVGLALYPEDGATRDSLLSAADAAMYVAKHSKRQIGEMVTEQRHSELTPEERT